MPGLLKFAVYTDHGPHPAAHFDASMILPDSQGTLLVVADSIGFYEGETASVYSIRRVKELWTTSVAPMTLSNRERLKLILLQVNQELYQQNYTAQGSSAPRLTAVLAAYVVDSLVVVAWVGHCRAYVVSATRRQALQITRDHTQAAEMISRGQESLHADPNALTRALGMNHYVEVDTTEGTLEEEDRLLICTDGLTRHLSEATMVSMVLKRSPVQKKVIKMGTWVKQNGADDSLTLILGEHPQSVPFRIIVLGFVLAVLLAAGLIAGFAFVLNSSGTSSTLTPRPEITQSVPALISPDRTGEPSPQP